MVYEFYKKERKKCFKVYYALFFLTVFFTASVQAQVTIGSDTPPKKGALLDLNQNYSSQSNAQVNSQKGLGLPRVSLVSSTSLAPMVETPTAGDSAAHIGLTVYNVTTDAGAGLAQGVYTWSGYQWVKILSSDDVVNNAWLTTGNAGTDSTQNFLGTTDAEPLRFRVNNAPAGHIGSSDTVNYNAIGRGALAANTAANNNAFGLNALGSNTTGTANTAVGSLALRDNITGTDNTAAGHNALLKNTGSGNTAMGSNSMSANVTGLDNTAVGLMSLNGTGGDANTAVGAGALQFSTSSYNTAVGFIALGGSANNSGTYNVAVGSSASFSNTSGTYNVAVGSSALFSNTSGSSNVAVGYSALVNSTGGNNTAIGYQAGSGITTGANNIAIGSNTGFTTTGTSNQLNIGNAIFGTGISGTAATPAGNIGIRTVPFTNRVLHVNASSNPLRFQNLPAPPDASTALNSLVIDGNGDVYASQASSAGQIIRIELEETTGVNTGTNPDYGGTNANGDQRPIRIVNVESQTPSRAPNGSSNYINTIRGAHFRWNYAAGAGNGAPSRTTDQVILPIGVYKVTLRIVGMFSGSAHDNTLFIKAIVDGNEYSLSNNAMNSEETATFLYEDFINITDREQSLDFTVDTKDGTANTFQIVPGATPGNSTGVSIRSLLLIERLR